MEQGGGEGLRFSNYGNILISHHVVTQAAITKGEKQRDTPTTRARDPKMCDLTSHTDGH